MKSCFFLLAMLLLTTFSQAQQLDHYRLVDRMGGPNGEVEIRGHLAYRAEGRNLVITNLQVPARPVDLGHLALVAQGGNLNPGNGAIFDAAISDLEVQGTWVYALTPQALYVIDASNPAAPALRGQVTGFKGAVAGSLVGTLVGVVEYGAGLRLVDVSNPDHPAIVGRYDDPDIRSVVAGAGRYFYYVFGHDMAPDALRIIDIQDPSHPTSAGVFEVILAQYDGINGLAIAGSRAYLAHYAGIFEVLDLTNPIAPTSLARITTGNMMSQVWLNGSLAMVGGDKIIFFDISDPAHPAIKGELANMAKGIFHAALGDNLLIASVDVSPQVDVDANHQIYNIDDLANPRLVGTIDQRHFSDVAVAGQRVCALDRRALTVYDRATTGTLTPRGQLALTTATQRVAVEGNLAILYYGASQIQFVDITNPDQPRLKGVLSAETQADNLVLSGGRAFITDGAAGLKIYDTTGPTTPTLLSQTRFTTTYKDLNGKDQIAQVAAGAVVVNGAKAYVVGRDYDVNLGTANGPFGLRVLDVSDPTSPTEIRRVATHGLNGYEIMSAAGMLFINNQIYDPGIKNPDGGYGGWIGTTEKFKLDADGLPQFFSFEEIVTSYDSYGSQPWVIERPALRLLDLSDPARPIVQARVVDEWFKRASSTGDKMIYAIDQDDALVALQYDPTAEPQANATDRGWSLYD